MFVEDVDTEDAAGPKLLSSGTSNKDGDDAVSMGPTALFSPGLRRGADHPLLNMRGPEAEEEEAPLSSIFPVLTMR